jgi:hypothetical protein
MSLPPGSGRPQDDKWREWRVDELGEATNTTRLDSNPRRHGLLPKLSGNATEALLGDGTWGTPINAVDTQTICIDGDVVTYNDDLVTV